MEFKDFDKKAIIKALFKYLQERLEIQEQEAQALLLQSSENNRKFFERFQQNHGQITKKQLDALNSYRVVIQSNQMPIREGALVYLSLRRVPDSPSFHYWLLLPNVAMYGDLFFEWNTCPIRVCTGIVGMHTNLIDQKVGQQFTDWADTHFTQALEIKVINVL